MSSSNTLLLSLFPLFFFVLASLIMKIRERKANLNGTFWENERGRRAEVEIN